MIFVNGIFKGLCQRIAFTIKCLIFSGWTSGRGSKGGGFPAGQFQV